MTGRRHTRARNGKRGGGGPGLGGRPEAAKPPQAGGPTDEQLVAAYVAGDEGAYDELVHRYAGRVYAIAYRYFGDQADAEDAAQEAFVALMRRAGSFRGTAKFSTWMYRVTTNACNDLARKRARRPRSAPADVDSLAGEQATEDVIANRELGLELAQALALLDADQRDAIVAHDVQGVPYADIAERTGVAVGTVKSRIHRGHARLAEALDHLRADAEPSVPPRPPTVQP